MASLSRVTISVPSSVARDLRRTAKMLGLSQSAVVVTLIATDLREIAKRKSGAPSPLPIREGGTRKRRRLRGASVVVVRETLAQALEAVEHSTAELPFGPVR